MCAGSGLCSQLSLASLSTIIMVSKERYDVHTFVQDRKGMKCNVSNSVGLSKTLGGYH